MLLTGLILTRNKWRKKTRFVRGLFIGFCFIVLPTVWLNSKGSMGAQPVYMAFFILLLTLLLDTFWASLLSGATVLIVSVLMLLEYTGILTFNVTYSSQGLILSNLIHYCIVYFMIYSIGITFKTNYNRFQSEYFRQSITDDLTQQPVSLSIGLVESTDKTAEQIIQAVDDAMYRVRQQRGE